MGYTKGKKETRRINASWDYGVVEPCGTFLCLPFWGQMAEGGEHVTGQLAGAQRMWEDNKDHGGHARVLVQGMEHRYNPCYVKPSRPQ